MGRITEEKLSRIRCAATSINRFDFGPRWELCLSEDRRSERHRCRVGLDWHRSAASFRHSNGAIGRSTVPEAIRLKCRLIAKLLLARIREHRSLIHPLARPRGLMRCLISQSCAPLRSTFS